VRDALIRDLRHAVRGLRSRPTYAVVTVLTLALVIGAATAIVAVINATMFSPLPYPEAHRLVRLSTQPPGTTELRQRNPLSVRTFIRFREGGLRLADAVEGFWARDRSLGGDGDPESVPGALASPGALPLLGTPIIGRTWTEEEDQANAKLVVLSYGLWQRRFGGQPSVLGRTVLVDREPYTVIGVMPPGFQAIYIEAELWTPLNAISQGIENSSTFIQTVARLRPGVTMQQLRAEVAPAMARVIAEAPNTMSGWTAAVDDMRTLRFAGQRPALLVLLAAVAALALIASANLANLTLAQVMARRGEIALRAALGAGRARVLQLQLVETLLLCAAGTAAGVALGALTLPALLALDPQTATALGDIRIDWRVQAVVALVATIVSLSSGVLPMLRALGADSAGGLADGSRRAIGSRREDRLRRALIGAEAALVVVLLTCGGLLLRGFTSTARNNPGFDPAHVLGAQLRLSPAAYPNEAARNAFVTRMLDRIRAVPGALAAATTLNAFIPGFTYQTLVHIEGRPTPDGQPYTVQFRRVSPDYFKTLRIPLLRGRDVQTSDGVDAPAVTVVSRSFADRFWPGEDAIGRQVRRNNGKLLIVVGVVGDVVDVGFGQPVEPTLYVPYLQNNPVIAQVSLVVRTSGDPLIAAAAVRGAVLSVDPSQPIDHLTTLEDFLRDSLGPQRFQTTLLLVLASLGLAMAAVGIYGVTARSVEERTREVGVRLALGAQRSTVWRLVVGQAMAAVVAGMVVGGVLAIAASSALVRWLPGLDGAEGWTVVPALIVLSTAALVAAAVPAARAVAVNPIAALRGE
jgi:predicted permease